MATKAKLKKGIIGLAFAIGTLNEGEDGTPSITYDKIENLVTSTSGGREYSISPRGDSQDIYANSVKVYGDSVNDGYDIDLTILSLLDRVVQEKWLNMKKTEKGVAEYADGEEYPYFALIIYENTSDGVGQTSIYPWCQASGRPEESGKTGEGGNFDWNYPTIPIAATPRPTDMLVRLLIDGKERLKELPEDIAAKQTLSADGDKVSVPASKTTAAKSGASE